MFFTEKKKLLKLQTASYLAQILSDIVKKETFHFSPELSYEM